MHSVSDMNQALYIMLDSTDAATEIKSSGSETAAQSRLIKSLTVMEKQRYTVGCRDTKTTSDININ